jgi:divalent metal cation (Fe/Co/Zn/Cd) transporter
VSAGQPTIDDLTSWVSRAQWLAGATIAYNLVEGAVAIAFGVDDESVALFGFGVDSLIEVASAVLVLWRFRGEQGKGGRPDAGRERRATLGIGLLFVALAAVVVLGAGLQLHARSHPETTVPGVVISALSLSFMFYLWRAKKSAATALDSATVSKDAACSLACIQLSTILLVGSLVFWLAPGLWWADALAALLLGAFIGREGVQTVRAARRPDFGGGCGCR